MTKYKMYCETCERGTDKNDILEHKQDDHELITLRQYLNSFKRLEK